MNALKNSLTAGSALVAGLFAAVPLAHAAEYATVISATPAVAQVSVPRQECADVEQYVQPQPSGAGALIGAIAGGVLGNQFGHGVGRAAATVGGVVAGSALGNHVEASSTAPGVVPVRRCRTVSAYESRTVGYDVVYEYHGQRYTTRMASDPGPRLAIDVRPQAAAPLDRVGPPATYGAVPPAGTYADVPPAYVESTTTYAPAPAYYAPAPAYYAPAPAYVYGPSSYVAPLAIGVGIGYWAGHRWVPGPRRWHHHY